MLSYQSLPIAHAIGLDSGFRRKHQGKGMNNWRRELAKVSGAIYFHSKGSGVVCPPHPTPSWGQAPALHSSFDPGLSLLGDGGWCRRPAPGFIHFRTNSGKMR